MTKNVVFTRLTAFRKRLIYNNSYEENGELYIYNSLTGLKCKIFDVDLKAQIQKLKLGGIEDTDIDIRLVDTQIAVAEGIEELVVAEDVIAERLSNNKSRLRLIILPTRECNFRCKYCYETKKNENMTLEMAENLINAVCGFLRDNKSINFLQLEWFGGEPLLCYETIIKISSVLKDYCEKNEITFSMSMTTNGYLLSKERAEKLLSLNLFEYQITVDGKEEYHDNLRVLKNGGRTWKTVYKNLIGLKTIDDDRLSVTIRINYHVGMLEDLSGFIEMIKRDFDKRFTVYAIRINPTPEFEKEFMPVNSEAEPYALEYIIDLLKRNELSIVRYLTNLSPTASACYARMNYVFVIDTDGTLRKCTEYLDDNTWNNIGTISNGVFEIDYYKHTQWLRPNPEYIQEKGCYDCKDYPNCCGGLCPAKWIFHKQVACNPIRGFNKIFLEQYIDENCNKK